ncbi:LysR family transcriptional regulator [Stackebrandtia nassauensis]|uniref:Transcriptional regulator, LysR family n=1 Tax=Stackebrandtia nassauensis (strain DSM 44728 / CIP 108903 / NRRL B-16338 / NBRC 102104 / LLR-40K-21) TaxID=446470 RepID=D3Q995_STANL|nr:LysR family transcriptional regulator [Stackebrandtia nassauensis]ADD42577.1 transcriptional regulator, LysR family [Stackebrandtia nassauensis DSM 44728]
MDPEIRHLRAICAIADAGSLSKAARVLGISQPALSAQLKRIERIVGAELFVRARSGVVPTPDGERTLERARMLLVELDAFVGGLRHPNGRTRTALRLGSAHMECVGTMIELVRKALPEYEVRLRVEPSAVILAQAVTHDRMDLAVIGTMVDHDVRLAPPVEQRVLVPQVPVFVAIASGHALASRPEIALSELAGESWICPPGADDGSLASLRDACRHAGFEARVDYEAPSGGARQLIESGQGVRLVEPTASQEPGIAVRPLTGDPLHMRYRLAWRSGRFTDIELGRVYRAVGQAYTSHAVGSPVFAPWWQRHPEVHPLAGA